MRIGQFSKESGICAYTLCYYEKKGLLHVERDGNGQCDYREADVEWVKFITRLKNTGMLLRDIKQYSDLRYQGDDTMEERMKLLLCHRNVVLGNC